MRKKSQKNYTRCEYQEEYTAAGFLPPPLCDKETLLSCQTFTSLQK